MELPKPREVYIAGPLFTRAEVEQNIALAGIFRSRGYKVFNPIEDGVEGAGDENATDIEVAKTIYKIDKHMVAGSSIFVANLDGPQVDDGTATEIGMADAIGDKLMLARLTDDRHLTRRQRRNPLCIGPFLDLPNKVFDNDEELVEYAIKNRPPLNT